MANWATTTYICVGDLKEVKSLHEILKDIDKSKTTILKNDFGKWWLGNLVHKLGGDWEKYRCRGEITDYYLNDNTLTINQTTAWCEQEGVRRIIEEKYPSIKVYYLEEEIGCGVYHTNDINSVFFDENFLVDGYDTWEYFHNIEQLAAFVESVTKVPVKRDFNACKHALDAYVAASDNDDIYYDVYELSRTD